MTTATKIKRTNLQSCARCHGDLLRRSLAEPPFCSKCRGFYACAADFAPREHTDIEAAMAREQKRFEVQTRVRALRMRACQQYRDEEGEDLEAEAHAAALDQQARILAAGTPPKRQAGRQGCFTLVDLCIAVSVVAIVLTVAFCYVAGRQG